MTNQYEQLGVSSDKKEVHNAIKNLDPGLFPGAFCKIFADTLSGDPDYCLIAHADGAGTKTSLAYLYWKATGDISVFRALAMDAIAMNLDDMICIGALGPYTFTQNIDRNKGLIPAELLDAIISGTNEAFEMLRALGIDITYNGGETADVGDLVRTITLNASMQARMRRKDVIHTKIQAGNVIVGLASDGIASYEAIYNSGIGSNGFTLARHKVLASIYKTEYPETFDPSIDDMAYSGGQLVTDSVEGIPSITVGQLLLSPTRTYAPVIKEILEHELTSSISAIIHCSGGGQKKCLNFAEKVRIVKDNLLPLPPVFSLIQRESGETWENMYTTFNMGSRMEIYCNEDVAERIIHTSEQFNINAQIIGYVEEAAETTLTIKSPYGTFEYQK